MRTRHASSSSLIALTSALALAAACQGDSAATGDTETTDGGSTTKTTVTTTTDSSTTESTGPVLFCVPGEVKCNPDLSAVLTCQADGQGYDEAPCGTYQQCYTDECLGPCELIQDPPSSEGCSFWSNRMRHYQEDMPDALIVGNVSNDKPATVQLYFIPNGQKKEEPQGDPVVVDPGKTYQFLLTNSFILTISQYRPGGTYHVVSDLPIVAYQHSPLDNTATNDSSLLLPDHSLKNDYVIASYPPFGEPSYFNVIATEDTTTVQWWPPADTAGNFLPVPFVNGGEMGSIVVNRGDVLQVGASSVNTHTVCVDAQTECMTMGGDMKTCDKVLDDCERRYHDVSGTVVHADKPIWVVGATNCAFVPYELGFCDHLQEQMFPLDFWGKEYVGAHSPARGGEKHYWRIFAGEDNVTVTAEPAQPGTPIQLAKRGSYADLVFDNGVSVIFKSDKPFLPVQYLAGASDGPGFGDPAMYQMVPTEQFLSRYVFVTGVNYQLNYAQVIHKKGDAPVMVDGVEVTGYYDIGDYEVADWLIEEGGHEAISDKPFGIIGIGYTIPSNCQPSFVEPNCDMDGFPRCCIPCVGKSEDAMCNQPDHPLCCTGPYASYAYPGGMRLKKIYNP
ncbi:MAG: IgGFc-binding protein [Nannocystaceae bacterium]